MNSSIRLLVLLTLGFLSTAAGYGQTVFFNVSLDNAQVSNISPLPNYGGTGAGSLTLNSGTGAWSMSGTFNTNYGTANNAHIHGPGAAFVDAGVIAPLTYSAAISGTFSGSGTFTGPQMSDLLAGLYYVNIHTQYYPAGEIRGQLTPVPEPSTYALAAGVIGLAAAGVWRARRRSAA